MIQAKVMMMALDGQIDTAEVAGLIQGVTYWTMLGIIMTFNTKMFIEAMKTPKSIAKEEMYLAREF